nr:thiol reductant ABC exporter subunit CydD [Acidobacteriota bacterium]
SRTLYILGVLAALKAGALVVIAGAIAHAAASLAAGQPLDTVGLLFGALGVVAHAVTAWALTSVSAKAAMGAKEALRGELVETLVRQGGRGNLGHGEATVLASSGLDALDKYYATYLPALVSCLVVPLLVGLRIASVDWVSAVIIVLTVPLIPLFMALIGLHTQEKVTAAAESLARLSNHLVELAKGLPVLVGLGRAQAQSVALRRVSDQYRTATMRTLRVAFLSALALELIATLSVAVVAVFIGVRLVQGGMSLELGLLALILAPECYAPLRELGSAHHASEDGRVAAAKAQEVLAVPDAADVRATGVGPDAGDFGGDAGGIRVTGLQIQYTTRTTPAVQELSFTVPAGGIAVLDGPSGSGKSSIIEALAGLVPVTGGTVVGIDPDKVAWIPQHPKTVADTVLGEVELYLGEQNQAPTYLQAVGLSDVAQLHPGSLSPGELRRLAVARALARVDAGATVLLADEPTAHLDAVAAHMVEQLLAGLRWRVTVVLAAHRSSTRALASVRVSLPGAVERDGQSNESLEAVPAEATTTTLPTAPREEPVVPRAARVSGFALLRLVQPLRLRFLAAVVVSVIATLAALSLGGLSGWLIVRASQQPPILYLLVAIVGVRFLGLMRASSRYAERLLLHDAVFTALTDLRVRLWQGLSSKALAHRALLRGDTAVDSLIGWPDVVRDLTPRVVLPPIAGVLSAVAMMSAVWLLVPEDVRWQFLAVQAFVLLVALVASPAIAMAAAKSATAEREYRSRVTRELAALLGAAADLRANRVEGPLVAGLRRDDAQATALLHRSVYAQGLAQGVLLLASGAGALLMLLAGHGMPAENLVALVLLQLAVPDAFGAVSAGAQLWPSLRTALAACAELLADDSTEKPMASESGEGMIAAGTERAAGIRLQGVTARWPEADAPAVTGIDASVSAQEWLTITGPSGSGKTTLLALMLGFLTPERGTVRTSRTMAWCPQEGHLFDSSLRANLRLARSVDEAPTDQELHEVLNRVGLGSTMDELSEGLETRLGPGGQYFSGGQRQRIAVARTLLTGAETILLDEPTAHLDAESAHSLMTDLRQGLANNAVVLVTHDADAAVGTDKTLVLH